MTKRTSDRLSGTRTSRKERVRTKSTSIGLRTGLPECMRKAYLEIHRKRTERAIEEIAALKALSGRISERSLMAFGSAGAAIEWLLAPEPNLKKCTPLSVAQTKRGEREIITLLRLKRRKFWRMGRSSDRQGFKRFLDLRAASKDGAIVESAGEVVSVEAAAQLLGVTDKAIYKSQKEGRILGYQEPGKRSYLLPIFQFDGAAVAPWVPELIEILGPGFAALHFLTVKRKHLDGASHLNLLLAARPDERHIVAQKILSEARSHPP